MKYHDITVNDMKNGDGLRVVLWVSGCDHHCAGCHNKITWDPNDGLTFTQKERDEIFSALSLPHISGITFSGGDPLNYANRRDVEELIYEIKKEFSDKTIWLYTGYKWEDIMYEHMVSARYTSLHRIISNIDVLVDGRYDESLRDENYPWAGSTNQRVIDVKATFENRSGEVVLHESK